MATKLAGALSQGFAELLEMDGEWATINAERVFCLVNRNVDQLDMQAQGYTEKVDLQISFTDGDMVRPPEQRTAALIDGVKFKVMGIYRDPGVMFQMDLHKVK